ncbi:hypothetical protein [Kineosporia sp. R_H_3]|uniref:hypothetical protein n=1 Tax=Kineosporia sp. R_H_3 TaxID=1961848 RepID=UPI0018E9D9A6|nr:hypothetical protein [Kineosporia sp. R_H_3]
MARPEAPFSEPLPVDAAEENRLWAVLREDPNDVVAFAQLAEVVRQHAAEGHPVNERVRSADDAVWSLAEELAHSPRAWFPLVELARLSIHDDRDQALRRLATAAERDPSGDALATGLLMLRDAGLPGDALNLGVGHWRPREHDLEAGRQLVEAAVEAGRVGEARRHLQALGQHPDAHGAAVLRRELERLIAIRSGEPEPPAAPPVAPPPTDLSLQDTPGPGYGSGPATGPIRLGPAEGALDVREEVVDLTMTDAQTPEQRRFFRRS